MSPDSKVVGSNIGKVPGRYSVKAGDWRGFKRPKGEPSLFATGCTADEQREARDWPTANVGMRGAAFPAIDSDVQSDDARRLVDRVIVEFQGFVGPQFAVRTRGNSPRTLYAFAPDGASLRPRPGAVRFTLPSDKAGADPHVVEVIGDGKHWVTAGQHPSGDRYGWEPDAGFAALVASNDLLRGTEADVERILDAVADAVERAGGTVLSRGDGKAAGSGSGELRDFSRDDPVMPVAAILRGLDAFPNTLANVPRHEDFVSALGAIRAALGREADAYGDDVRQWATAHEDDTGADDAYFDRVWGSLDAGVRAGPDSLDRWFRRAGIFVGATADFPDDVTGADAVAANAKWEADGRNTRRRLLQAAADGWRFKTVNMRTDDTNARVRRVGKINSEEIASQWWDMKTTDAPARDLLPEIQKVPGWETGLQGLWQFLTDLHVAHPDAYYFEECFHPLFDVGHMIPVADDQGNTEYKVNMRPLPKAQKIAQRMRVSGIPSFSTTRFASEFSGLERLLRF